MNIEFKNIILDLSCPANTDTVSEECKELGYTVTREMDSLRKLYRYCSSYILTVFHRTFDSLQAFRGLKWKISTNFVRPEGPKNLTDKTGVNFRIFI